MSLAGALQTEIPKSPKVSSVHSFPVSGSERQTGGK